MYLSGKVIKGRINDNRYQICNHEAFLEFTVFSEVGREDGGGGRDPKMRKLCITSTLKVSPQLQAYSESRIIQRPKHGLLKDTEGKM